jgi:hypothetical protein
MKFSREVVGRLMGRHEPHNSGSLAMLMAILSDLAADRRPGSPELCGRSDPACGTEDRLLRLVERCFATTILPPQIIDQLLVAIFQRVPKLRARASLRPFP